MTFCRDLVSNLQPNRPSYLDDCWENTVLIEQSEQQEGKSARVIILTTII